MLAQDFQVLEFVFQFKDFPRFSRPVDTLFYIIVYVYLQHTVAEYVSSEPCSLSR
jgi:hypothetical protein